MERGNIQQPLSSNNGNGNGKHLYLPSPIPLTQPVDKEQDELNLRHLVSVVRRRAVVIAGVAIAVTSAISFWTFSQTPKYEGKFQLLVEPVTEEGNLDKLTQVPGVSESPGSILDYDTQIEVLRSPNLMAPILEEIEKDYKDVSYDSLIGSSELNIERLAETKILEVRYRDTDPKKVRFVLHQVARGYLRYSLQERQINLKKGIQFVEGQLPQLRDRVDKLQGQLQAFRQQNNLLDPETQAQQLSTRVSAIEQEQLQTQVGLREARSLYTTISSQLGLSPNEALATAALSEAPRYQELLNKLQEVEAKIATELSRFTEESPTVQALRNEQRNLLPLLEQESQRVLGANLSQVNVSNDSPNSIRLELTQQLVDATNQIQVLQVRQNAIAQAERSLNLQVKQMPVIARQYTDLQRELNVATESLNRFLGFREGLQIEVAQKALPWQIILKPQEPQFPVSPNTQRNILLGAVAGLLLGIGAALLVERLDNVFHSPDELKDRSKLPLLGVIPYNKQLKVITPVATVAEMVPAEDSTTEKKNRRKPQWYTASPFLESFRSLHTNIRFLGSDTPIHSIVISSATPADGKSTIAVHLAQAAAAMGQRVLLVDADLRRPQVHKILGLENKVGLSNVIATGITAKQAIQRLPMWDHLYVLTAGQLPPDPTRLLCSRKMQYLMEQFHAVFDLVIYDTPPTLGLADGRLLAAHTDGVVMVAGLGRTDRSVLMQALDGMKVSNATVLGVVANGVKGYTTSSYYNYQQYYVTDSEVLRAKQLLQKKID
ncbi:polysaccharide biosynthesis tyrosine autokinase [Microcoleus sp. FACHB-SPT15]|uniref:GumC family protein n=1 Tax=Microcoleus sp. FACHB-SPT15 TaxID=2692830 RepID=UPI0017836540|nr:polysaccharide biosynthesis tyrosine autokinase [Microcoleus sp. FACHB-SPT15]MBD1808219.1 polysaccharide biosynthesis tyrosine autokinase [Microcoleus sp. FACHB-SPT15]